MSRELEHIVQFEHGFDCIRFKCRWGKSSCKPGAGGSHGRHGLSIRFLVKGESGAVQFLLHTGWGPQKTQPDRIGYRGVRSWAADVPSEYYPSPADLGFHSKEPKYDDQEPVECAFVEGGKCYYDGSGLNANDAMYALVNAGEDGLWSFLEDYYRCVFEGGKYPTPSEYEHEERP